jgi:hypothetical protein
MLETLLSYGTVASNTHLTNSFWHKGSDNIPPTDPLAVNPAADAKIYFGL